MNRREFLTGGAATGAAALVAVGNGRDARCPSAFNGRDARCPSYSVVVVGGGPAGTAAALACAVGVAPRALDAGRLVSTLRAQKVFI